MATTQLYNHTVNRFNSGANLETDTYKVMLLNGGTFTTTHTTLAQVVATATGEVSGNGWPVGGYTLENVVSAASDDDASWTFDEVIQAVSGGSLGPYDHYVIYNDTDADDPPVCLITMDSALTVTDGNAASIKPPVEGLITWTVV